MADLTALKVLALLWIWSQATGQSPIQALYVLHFGGVVMESTANSSLHLLLIGLIYLLVVNFWAVMEFECECFEALLNWRMPRFLQPANHQSANPRVRKAARRKKQGQRPRKAKAKRAPKQGPDHSQSSVPAQTFGMNFPQPARPHYVLPQSFQMAVRLPARPQSFPPGTFQMTFPQPARSKSAPPRMEMTAPGGRFEMGKIARNATAAEQQGSMALRRSPRIAAMDAWKTNSF